MVNKLFIAFAVAVVWIAVAPSLALAAAAKGGGEGEGGEGGPPPAVNTTNHPDALILNTKNPLAIHAGPGKPNVGVVYLPPSLSGKDKGKNAKAGQTEEKVMGGAPTH